jgi:hypothetical protein
MFVTRRLLAGVVLLALLAPSSAQDGASTVTVHFDGLHTIAVDELLDRYARPLDAVVQTDGHADVVVLHFRPALYGPLSWEEACLLLELNGIGVAPHCEDPRDIGHTIRAFTMTCFTGKADQRPSPDPLHEALFTAVVRLADAPADPRTFVLRLRAHSFSALEHGRELHCYYLASTRTVLLVGDVEEVDRVRATLV